MNSALESAIRARGSKPAIYEHFIDDRKLRKYIPPFITLESGKSLTNRQRTFLRRILSNAGTNEALVRTSQGWSDWIGNVDTMPSPSCTLETIDKTIDETRAQCHDQALVKHARLEKNGYDPHKVHHLIVPNYQTRFADYYQGSMTEHPNQNEELYIDVYDKNAQLHYPVNFTGGRVSNDMFSLRSRHVSAFGSLDATQRMHRDFRESNQFSVDDALQMEFGLIETKTAIKPLLYQVRRFAQMCLVTEEERIAYNIGPNQTERMVRVLGKTPQEGLHLPVYSACTIQDTVDKANENQRPCIVAPLQPRDELGTIIAPEMRVFIPNGNYHCVQSMQHQITRFAMHCLRNGGTVILDSGNAFKMVANAAQATVITNGTNYAIIPTQK